MVVKQITRSHICLVSLLGLLLALLGSATVNAQSGSCPDYTDKLTLPAGTNPSSMEICSNPVESGTITIESGQNFPCGQAIYFDTNYASNTSNQHDTLTIVPPAAQNFPSGFARIYFQFSAQNQLGGNYQGSVTAKLSSFRANGTERGFSLNTLTDFPVTVSQFGTRIYEVDLLIPFSAGGFLELVVTQPAPLFIDVYWLGSLNVVDGTTGVSLYKCPIAGMPTETPTAVPTNQPTATIPATWTPGATPTGATMTPSLTPENTPTQTATAQSFPTSAGGTPSPPPTQTPYQISTTQAPNTPTTIPPLQFPTVSLPSVELPAIPQPSTPQPVAVNLTPNSTSEATLATIQAGSGEFEALATRVGDTTGEMFETMSVSNTFGVSNTQEMADRFQQVVTDYNPISYFISIKELFPYTWAILFVLLLAFFWKTFIRVVLFIVGFVTDILINIWQQFPFT
jgi:hypothetical protein